MQQVRRRSISRKRLASSSSSKSTASSSPTPLTQGNGNSRARSRSKIQQNHSALSEIGNRSLSRSRTRSEKSVITVKIKKKPSEEKVAADNALRGGFPVVENKSFTMRRANKPQNRRVIGSKSKLVEKPSNPKKRQQVSRFRSKSVGIGSRSKLLWRKRLKDPEDPLVEQKLSEDGIMPLLFKTTSKEFPDSPIENPESKALKAATVITCNEKVSNYFNKENLMSASARLMTNEKSKSDKIGEIQYEANDKSTFSKSRILKNGIPVTKQDSGGEEGSKKLYMMPSLMDSESASFTCDYTTDEDTMSADENVEQKSFNNTSNEDQANNVRGGSIFGSDKLELEPGETSRENDENKRPVSGMLQDGVFYLGEKADRILSKAFPKRTGNLSLPSFTCGHSK